MSKYGEPEIYSRFLRKDWIKENNTKVHFKAFLPTENKTTHRFEVSCFETQLLDIEQIKQIFRINNILPNNKPPIAHCSIPEKDFLSEKLSIDRNYEPERHVDLIGWEKYQSKEDRNEISSLLAEISSDIINIYEDNA